MRREADVIPESVGNVTARCFKYPQPSGDQCSGEGCSTLASKVFEIGEGISGVNARCYRYRPHIEAYPG
jgi:hypothetical protein